jgi:hypothetical protein
MVLDHYNKFHTMLAQIRIMQFDTTIYLNCTPYHLPLYKYKKGACLLLAQLVLGKAYFVLHHATQHLKDIHMFLIM